MGSMPTGGSISSGVSLLYYLYEVSEAIDLQRLQQLLGSESSKTRLSFKYGTPGYLQFQNPPLVASAEPIEWRERQYQCRIKFYDYGVVSITLQAAFSGTWDEFIALSAEIVGNPDLEATVAAAVDRRLERLRPALLKPLASRMMEDYVIYGVLPGAEKLTGLEFAARHSAQIAQLLRGESSALSDAEVAEVMANPLSERLSWGLAGRKLERRLRLRRSARTRSHRRDFRVRQLPAP